MYANGDLPQDFFSNERVWLTRGRTCCEFVEPIDIANYYRNALWRSWLPGRRHYIESDNRPGDRPGKRGYFFICLPATLNDLQLSHLAFTVC